MKKVICFSLWGNKDIYCIGAIKNADLVSEIYHGWKMLVYYDNTVPTEIIKKLQEKKCNLY